MSDAVVGLRYGEGWAEFPPQRRDGKATIGLLQPQKDFIRLKGRYEGPDIMIHGWIIPWESVHTHHRMPTFDPGSSIMRNIPLLTTLALVAYPLIQANAQANAGPDQEVCGTSTTLQGNPPIPGDSGFWTLVSGNATFADASDPLTTVTDLALGGNILMWTHINGFGATTDEVAISGYEGGWLANAGTDQTIYGPPFTAQLAATACVFPCTCSWSIVAGNGSFSDPTDPYSLFSALNVSSNTLRWTCGFGPCWTTDQTTITASLSTGVEVTIASGWNTFHFDPNAQLLVLNASGMIEGLTLFDARGGTVDLHSSGSARSWNVAIYPPGVYVVRAIVDGDLHTHRFVLNR